MTEFLVYDLKVALLIVVFYGFYCLLVARDTFHRLNRAVLLASLALSLALPLVHVTVHKEILPGQTLPLPLPMREGSNYSLQAESENGGLERLSTPLPDREGQGGESAAFLLLVGLFFLAGCLFCLARTLMSIVRVRQIIARGERHEVPSYISWRTPRMRLVVVDDENVKPFSWMNTVVLSRKDYEQDLRDGRGGQSVILAHECGHVACRHSVDMLLVDVIVALQWFNPVVWLLREELRTVHEYEADDRVLSQGFNAYQYLNLLILKAAGDAGYSIANGISTESALQKRVIMMMNKNKSTWRSWTKLLYIVPIVAVSLVATARVVQTPTQQTLPQPLPIREGSNYSQNVGNQEESLSTPLPDREGQGGGSSSAFALTTHVPNGAAARGIVIKVPEKVRNVNSQGKSNVAYYDDDKLIVVDGSVVSKDKLLMLEKDDIEWIDVFGAESAKKVFDDRGAKGAIVIQTNQAKSAQAAEPFALHAVVDEAGRIAGFTHEGKPDARQPMTFPVGRIFIDGHEATADEAANYQSLDIESFEIVHHPNTAGDAKYGYKDKEGLLSLRTAQPTDEPIFDIVEEVPSFPGGNEKMMEYLMHNAKYPKEAIEQGTQGRVIVKFVVEKDGSLTNLKVVKSISANKASASTLSVVAYKREASGGDEVSKTEHAELASKLLDEEALRVVRLMPKWTPGKQRGKVVRSWFTLPVVFRLS